MELEAGWLWDILGSCQPCLPIPTLEVEVSRIERDLNRGIEKKILRLSVGKMPVETPTRGAGYSMTDNRK